MLNADYTHPLSTLAKRTSKLLPLLFGARLVSSLSLLLTNFLSLSLSLSLLTNFLSLSLSLSLSLFTYKLSFSLSLSLSLSLSSYSQTLSVSLDLSLPDHKFSIFLSLYSGPISPSRLTITPRPSPFDRLTNNLLIYLYTSLSIYIYFSINRSKLLLDQSPFCLCVLPALLIILHERLGCRQRIRLRGR